MLAPAALPSQAGPRELIHPPQELYRGQRTLAWTLCPRPALPPSWGAERGATKIVPAGVTRGIGGFSGRESLAFLCIGLVRR